MIAVVVTGQAARSRGMGQRLFRARSAKWVQRSRTASPSQNPGNDAEARPGQAEDQDRRLLDQGKDQMVPDRDREVAFGYRLDQVQAAGADPEPQGAQSDEARSAGLGVAESRQTDQGRCDQQEHAGQTPKPGQEDACGRSRSHRRKLAGSRSRGQGRRRPPPAAFGNTDRRDGSAWQWACAYAVASSAAAG